MSKVNKLQGPMKLAPYRKTKQNKQDKKITKKKSNKTAKDLFLQKKFTVIFFYL